MQVQQGGVLQVGAGVGVAVDIGIGVGGIGVGGVGSESSEFNLFSLLTMNIKQNL